MVQRVNVKPARKNKHMHMLCLEKFASSTKHPLQTVHTTDQQSNDEEEYKVKMNESKAEISDVYL